MITKTDKTSETRIIREFLARRIENERQRWNHCLALTMIWGLIAHGYGFLNFTINHDSLNEFYLSVTTPWKITLGRFLSPFLRYVMGEVMTLPWLNGLTGLIFAGLACYFISKMFKLDIVWENILLTGISITNITVTALIASYIHDFSGDMLALLLSVCSVYAWDKMSHAFSMKYTLFGIACLAASLGLYQGYLSVAITLMCLKMIVDLLNGQSRVAVFRKIWHAILLGIGSLLAYMLCSSIVLRIYGLKFNSYGVSAYNFIAEPIAFIKSIIKGYIYVIEDVLFPNYESSIQSVFPSAAFLICLGNLFLTCYAGKIFVDSLKKGGISRWTVALLIFLIICLPVCMICVCIFSSMHHNLMRYAVTYFYLAVILMFKHKRESHQEKPISWYSSVAFVVIILSIVSNIQISNVAYVKKDLERQATFSTMTRVLSRLEEYENYDYKESSVAIVGSVNKDQVGVNSGFVDRLIGISQESQITYRDSMARYFDIVLQYPIDLCSEEEMDDICKTEKFQKMGVFPQKDSIDMVGDIIVVKMSE